MLTNNNPSVFYTEAEFAQLEFHLQEVRKILGNRCPQLSNKELRAYGKYGDANSQFTQKALTANQQNPGLLPRYVDAEDWEKNFHQAQRIRVIKTQATQTFESIRSLYFYSGWKAYSDAQSYYRSVKQGAKMGVLGAETIYNQLKYRFEGMGPQPKKKPPVPSKPSLKSESAEAGPHDELNQPGGQNID